MCANLGRLEDDVKALESAGCDELHADVADGLFAPGFTLGPQFVKAAKESCALPCNAHLMVNAPERHIARFAAAGCDGITVHIEDCVHVRRVLAHIRDLGVSPGVAVNPCLLLR